MHMAFFQVIMPPITLTCISCSNAAQQELSLLLQQASQPDVTDKFQQQSGGETWEQNTRRIANDVVSDLSSSVDLVL